MSFSPQICFTDNFGNNNNGHFQFEQRKFLQQHKIRADSYSKAAATMKKQRKKKNNAQNTDKEIKVNIHIFISLENEHRETVG